MSKHTPGPWFIWMERALQEEGNDAESIEIELLEDDCFDVLAGEPHGDVTRGSVAGCARIVQVDAGYFGDTDEEGSAIALANARLIAAAPDLLEFAEEVRRTGDTRLASMAIAVINKATGGQS